MAGEFSWDVPTNVSTCMVYLPTLDGDFFDPNWDLPIKPKKYVGVTLPSSPWEIPFENRSLFRGDFLKCSKE